MTVHPSAVRAIIALALFGALSSCFFGNPETPLGRASGAGDLATMTALLDQGADPNTTGAFGMTPLASAARNGRVEAIDLLLARGADAHFGCGVNGWSPLLHAIHRNQKAAALRLTTYAAPSPELDQALFMAAGYAQVDVVTALLKQGADPRAEFDDGANALSNAVSGASDVDFTFQGCAPHTATVRALLATADVKLEGSAGASARRAAERRACAELLALLN